MHIATYCFALVLDPSNHDRIYASSHVFLLVLLLYSNVHAATTLESDDWPGRLFISQQFFFFSYRRLWNGMMMMMMMMMTWWL
jgi:hypothetical protein